MTHLDDKDYGSISSAALSTSSVAHIKSGTGDSAGWEDNHEKEDDRTDNEAGTAFFFFFSGDSRAP